MIGWYRSFLVACIAFLLLLTTGSGPNTATAGSSGKPVICRLACPTHSFYAPQLLASRKGWFSEKGVTIQEVKLSSNASIAGAETLVLGGADVLVSGDVPAIIALASNRECVLIAAFGGGEKMHSIVVGSKSGIHKPADLVGKRIGVTYGTSTFGALQYYLELQRIAPTQVTLVNVARDAIIEALMSGSIDALAASEPVPTVTKEKVTGSRELTCLSGLGNDYPLVMVATRAFADAHPEAINALVEGTRRGVAWINRDADGAAVETAKITGVPAKREAAFFRRLEWRVRLDQKVISSLQNTASFLYRHGKLKRVPDIKALSRPEFVQASNSK